MGGPQRYRTSERLAPSPRGEQRQQSPPGGPESAGSERSRDRLHIAPIRAPLPLMMTLEGHPPAKSTTQSEKRPRVSTIEKRGRAEASTHSRPSSIPLRTCSKHRLSMLKGYRISQACVRPPTSHRMSPVRWAVGTAAAAMRTGQEHTLVQSTPAAGAGRQLALKPVVTHRVNRCESGRSWLIHICPHTLH